MPIPLSTNLQDSPRLNTDLLVEVGDEVVVAEADIMLFWNGRSHGRPDVTGRRVAGKQRGAGKSKALPDWKWPRFTLDSVY